MHKLINGKRVKVEPVDLAEIKPAKVKRKRKTLKQIITGAK